MVQSAIFDEQFIKAKIQIVRRTRKISLL